MVERLRVSGVTEAGQSLMLCGCDGGASGDQRWLIHCPLHAAAPDLLAALEFVTSYAPTGYYMTATKDEWMEGLRSARAAIAKATGGIDA